MATTAHTPHRTPFDDDRQRAVTRRAIAKNSYCTLATSSARNRPHVAGVLYAEVDGQLYVNTLFDSVKARNIRENNRVAVCIPVRKYPFGPPLAVQFQAVAAVVAVGDPRLVELAETGRIKAITSHGELELPGSCFLRITPAPKVVTYGLGVSLRDILRDPTGAVRGVDLAA